MGVDRAYGEESSRNLGQEKQTRQKELSHVIGQSLDWGDTTSVTFVKTLLCTILRRSYFEVTISQPCNIINILRTRTHTSTKTLSLTGIY
jgi:hypothetical protein